MAARGGDFGFGDCAADAGGERGGAALGDGASAWVPAGVRAAADEFTHSLVWLGAVNGLDRRFSMNFGWRPLPVSSSSGRQCSVVCSQWFFSANGRSRVQQSMSLARVRRRREFPFVLEGMTHACSLGRQERCC